MFPSGVEEGVAGLLLKQDAFADLQAAVRAIRQGKDGSPLASRSNNGPASKIASLAFEVRGMSHFEK